MPAGSVKQTERLYKIEQMLSESAAVPIDTLLDRLEIARAAFKRDLDTLHKASESLRHADPTEAAWWFGLMSGRQGKRALRALRIFVEAVK